MELIIINRKGERFTVLYNDEDHELITSNKWYVGADGYVRTVERLPKLMHRMILCVTDKFIHVDHKNHNKLDNQRSNIRTANRSQNMANRKSGGKSKYLGVSLQTYIKNSRTYSYIVATIIENGKKKTIGRFKTEEDAAKAYDRKAIQVHGEFANLNFPLI